jgi:hypothetical protein
MDPGGFKLALNEIDDLIGEYGLTLHHAVLCDAMPHPHDTHIL